MKLIIRNIRYPFFAQEEDIIHKVLHKKGILPVAPPVVCKRSVDARHKPEIDFVCTLLVESESFPQNDPDVSLFAENDYPRSILRATTPAAARPIIIGFGPCGMFCALLLAREGYRPIVFEQGEAVEKRRVSVEKYFSGGALNPSSNVGFGEGGAGTFSDGKLITRINDSRTSFVLSELVAHGAPQSILTDARPHIGTDYLVQVVKNIREEILSLGGEIHFETAMTDLVPQNNGCLLTFSDHTNLWSDGVFLAIGHSAHDTYRRLFQRGFEMNGKDFSVGMRIEHLQAQVDHSLYGQALNHKKAALLPKGEYTVSHRKGNRGVYSFCMCPGGVVVPAACHDGAYVTNGMSYHARDGKNANAAIAISVLKEDYGGSPMEAIAFQERLERLAFALGGGVAPCQTLGDFLEGKKGTAFSDILPTSPRGHRLCDLTSALSNTQISLFREGFSKFARQFAFFSNKNAPLSGYETKTSAPLRIERGADGVALGKNGIYPCGEGAGYAGGITSAATDGLRVAEYYVAKHSPKN